MSDAPLLPFNLNEVENAISNEGTVIVHGIDEAINTTTHEINAIGLHERIEKLEAFIIRLEERLRILRFW